MGSDKRCYDFVAAYPQTEVALHPNKEEVAIVVSQDALIGNTPKASDFTRGGFAAIVNYDLMGIRSSSGVGSNDYLSASTQLRSEEHTSELQSLMRISYAVFCLKKKKQKLHIAI